MKHTLPRCYSLATICNPALRKHCVLLKEETQAHIQWYMDAEGQSPRQELTCQLIKTKVRNFQRVANGRTK